MRNCRFKLYQNKVVETELNNCRIELDKNHNASRNLLVKALVGREPTGILAENRPLLHKLKRASSLEREATCGRRGISLETGVQMQWD